MMDEDKQAKVWNLLGAVEAPKVSTDFKARVWERIKEQEQTQPTYEWFPRLGWTFAGFAVAWVLGLTTGGFLYTRDIKARTSLSWANDTNSIAQVYLARR